MSEPRTELERRCEAAALACSLAGVPYVWGGKALSAGGLDCSGLATLCLARVRAIPAGVSAAEFSGLFNADRLWRELAPTADPAIGDLAFYGTPVRATHVAIVVRTGERIEVMSASGGGSWCTSPEIAKKKGACVRLHLSARYRRDFMGYRKAPF